MNDMLAGSRNRFTVPLLAVLPLIALGCSTVRAEEWPQLKSDAHHSGNVTDRDVLSPLGLVGAVALTDAIFKVSY